MHTLLFVCGHNAGRSQMAEAYFNHRNANPNCRAASAGTHPSSQVNSVVVKLLEAEGISTENLHPKMVTPEMIEQAAEVYTMGCGVKDNCLIGVDIVDLDLDDPQGQNEETIARIFGQLQGKLDPVIARWQN
jgi:arsenate reductase